MSVTPTLKKSLGTTPPTVQNGLDIYKFIFGNYPDLRTYFKGAEKFTPDDVQKSERFEKLGVGLLQSITKLVDNFDDKAAFKKIISDLMDRHVERKLDPALWLIFWTVLIGYLKTKGSVDGATEAAWNTFGKEFSATALAYLASIGQPH